jgi:hypothetical protein
MDLREFLVGENPVPGDLLRGQRDLCGWGLIQDALPTHQRRNVLIDFKVLLTAIGAPRCSIDEITSTT